MALLAGLFVMGTATSAQADGQSQVDDGKRSVWVCKYMGTPGVDESLKPGKQPIAIESDVAVGESMNDAQGRSFILAEQTGENTSTTGNSYIGEAACPGGDLPQKTEVTAVASVVESVGCEVGSFTIPATTGVEYLVNGGPVTAGTYSEPLTGTIAARSADETRYQLSNPEFSLEFDLRVPESCDDEEDPRSVTASASFVAAVACTAGSYTIPDTEGVEYLVNGSEVTPGTYTTPLAGSITAKSADADEYVLANPEYELHFDLGTAGTDCGDNNPPDGGDPPVVVPPVKPTKPAAVVSTKANVNVDCDVDEVVTTTTTTTTDWVYDEATSKWVPGAPQVVEDIETREATVDDCPEVAPVEGEKPVPAKPTKPTKPAPSVDVQPDEVEGVDSDRPKARPQPVVAGQPEALPTAVDAGLAPVAAASPSSPLGQGLLAGGLVMLLLAGALQAGRRERGAHEV